MKSFNEVQRRWVREFLDSGSASTASGPLDITKQGAFIGHIIAELPHILIHGALHGDEVERDKAIAAYQKAGDEARHLTFANFISNKIAAFAKNEHADAINYTKEQVTAVRELLEKLQALGRNCDTPAGGEVIRIDGGYFAKVIQNAPHPDAHRSLSTKHLLWSEGKREFYNLLEDITVQIEGGEVLITQGTSGHTQGPVHVDRRKISQLFVERVNLPDNVVSVRGEPVSFEGEEN